MALPALRFAVCRHTLRRTLTTSLPRLATSSPPEPVPSSISASPSSPGGFSGSAKVESIVDQISTLTLLEAADLVQALKTRLNIADVPMVAAAPPSSAPASASSSTSSEPAAETKVEAEKPKEKQAFKVTLKSIDAAQKAKAIKEVKAAISGMNLVEAKKFVESAPQVIKESMPKEEAEKLQKALEAVGAVVALE